MNTFTGHIEQVLDYLFDSAPQELKNKIAEDVSLIHIYIPSEHLRRYRYEISGMDDKDRRDEMHYWVAKDMKWKGAKIKPNWTNCFVLCHSAYSLLPSSSNLGMVCEAPALNEWLDENNN